MCLAGSVLLASAKPRFIHQTGKRDSSLQRTCFHCSVVQWRRALHHPSQRLASCMVILCAAAQPWKPISRSSRLTFIALTLLLEAVWNSVLSVATKDRWLLRATRFSTCWSRSVSLCGLPLRGWVVVGKVASYDGATLKVTELFSKAILLPIFIYGDCMAVCSIVCTCQQQVWLK